MKNNPVYSIAFIVLLCVICAGVLTGANLAWQSRIDENKQLDIKRATVEAAGLVEIATATRDEVLAAHAQCITTLNNDGFIVYEIRSTGPDGDITGYAVPFEAKGKYGPIKGILAVNSTKEKILGLRIYEQQETPGLGGRIGDDEWLVQFTGKGTRFEGAPGVLITSKKKTDETIDAISGASKTMFALNVAIDESIAGLLAGGRKLEKLNLGMDVITRASPGYPEKYPKPKIFREVGKDYRRPPFMVPPGVVNVAVGKPVTCNIEEGMGEVIGDLARITDGGFISEEKSQGVAIESYLDTPYVQIDLGQEQPIYCVGVWHYYKNPIIFQDVIVQVATKEDFSDARILFNNDHDNSAKLGEGTDPCYVAGWFGELCDARLPNGDSGVVRYVRVYTSGGNVDDTGSANVKATFIEVAVYGKKGK